MSLSGLAFLFDIIVEDLKSFVPTKKFVIRSQFADIFSLVLKNPEPNLRKRKRKKASKDNTKAKDAKKVTDSAEHNKKSQKGQTILFVGNIDTLMAHMLQYPMELCLCSEYNPEERIGSTLIPWNNSFIEYMMSLYHEAKPAPANVRSVYNVFNEATSKRMAAIRLNIKLRITDYINLNQYTALSNRHPNTFIKMDIEQLYIHQSTTTRLCDGTGTIKTIYSDGKNKKRSSVKKRNAKRKANIAKIAEYRDQKFSHAQPKNEVNKENKIQRNLLLHLTRSDINIVKPFKLDQYIRKNLNSKSCTAIKQVNLFDYIFGDRSGPFGNKTYTVGYATVNIAKNKTPSASSSSPPATESPGKATSKSSTSLEPDYTTVKCDTLSCIYKKERPLLEKPDDRILLDITSVKHSCCVTDTIERQMEIIGGTTEEKDPCYCACECTFGFERKTTYCKICKGYEKRGDDLDGKPQYLMPDPCPVYHKISRIKTGSTSGSDSKKKSKSIEQEKVEENEKKAKKNDRFKFNYGYKAPKIGHDRCVLPCTGTMSNVPKHMGWLWTADNVPGLMFRPSWKPGAINKVVARKLRNALHPGEVTSKRRKAPGPKKRPLKRPLLVVHKKDGEFTVTMETMKTYNRPRTINQPPYEDKPALTYTIGRTEEENRERRKKRERAARRLEREQREFIQSAFTDMCKEICLKTYQQALGILPDAEDPECACYPPLPDPNRVNEDRSCSCSDDGDSLASDTDSDEWILEFTAPTAYYDSKYQGTKVKTVDNGSQYTYLDYRVKLTDRFGNAVPRFFKGPDGKEQCSDLGGFWSPSGHNWLQINVDGFIGPDGRWAPFTFIGPSGEPVDTDTGKFQDTEGNWLVIGVDGYVDGNKWKFYKQSAEKIPGTKTTTTTKTTKTAKKKLSKTRIAKHTTDNKDKAADKDESLPTFSCFGDASVMDLSRMGIVGHGPDKKLLSKMLNDLIAKGVKVKVPQTPRLPKSPASGMQRQRADKLFYRPICRHPKPSDKGVIENFGSRSYFRRSEFKNRSSKARIHDLEQQGKSLSTFHEPCFNSNLDCKKRRQRRRVVVMMPHAHKTHDSNYT
ncbi:uncharacterized protein LOC134793004 isoform X2 [Cydia splendana]|uniref:uncharacterized protein LOC134793004 isoform X2 n=1 Tax=Cydia splendana TaxID=1100963 RepID=UPI00300DB0A5